MLDLGLSKLALIGVVGLIVLGPERLPKVARVLGALIGRAQRYVRDVKDEVSKDMDLAELKKMGQAANAQLQDVQQDLAQTWQDATGEPLTVSPYSARTPSFDAQAVRAGRHHWGVKIGRVPQWYKRAHRIPKHLSSDAARMKKHRKSAAHTQKSRSSFFY
jgi:sec-independent protein translocase protein TatB